VSLLAKVQRGRTPRPPRLLVYGTPGIGKSTIGASAPKPIFVPTEDGLDEIDCAKFPLAATLDEVLAALAELRTQPHDFETVVLDSLDWLERLIWDRVCAEFSVKNIEKADGGYARGYTHAVTHWREVVDLYNPLMQGHARSSKKEARSVRRSYQRRAVRNRFCLPPRARQNRKTVGSVGLVSVIQRELRADGSRGRCGRRPARS